MPHSHCSVDLCGQGAGLDAVGAMGRGTSPAGGLRKAPGGDSVCKGRGFLHSRVPAVEDLQGGRPPGGSERVWGY